VHNRGFSLTPEAQEGGLILMEQAHRVIVELQNDPECVEMTRVPIDIPIESQEGPSDPEPIQIGETTRSDNPKVSMP
jgi:hypothetical protein